VGWLQVPARFFHDVSDRSEAPTISRVAQSPRHLIDGHAPRGCGAGASSRTRKRSRSPAQRVL